MKLLHDELLSVLHKLIDISFNGGVHKFINISKFGARWFKEPSDHQICFNKRRTKDGVSYLLTKMPFYY